MGLVSVCSTPGCPELVRGSSGYCVMHRPRPWASSNRRAQLPSNWTSIRKKVLKRDGHRCVKCGSSRRLEVDHKVASDDHRIEALQTLCAVCHRAKTQAEAAAARWSN